ncbi:MAG: hypothetical protein K0R67_2745, partial [Paenibacillus sp.]|nr:hypothetical protein [Paenibacillus sp.]
YEASLTQGSNLSHLLPHFHVSAFMRPVWDVFWQERCSPLLTMALIINEQHYIEGRVIRTEPYSSLLASLLFQAQAALQMNAIVFPYAAEQSPSPSSMNRLAGLVIETFSDLSERIELGKKLYAILFGVPAIYNGVTAFASMTDHTGSRADYWPHLFTNHRKADSLKGSAFLEKLSGCELLEGADLLYSPLLTGAWPDQPVQSPEHYDWLTDLAPLAFFSNASVPMAFEITNEYGFILNKLELTVMTEQQWAD